MDYDPDEYGEHEGRRERRHAALSILSDQEALLEQALDNNEVRFFLADRPTVNIIQVQGWIAKCDVYLPL